MLLSMQGIPLGTRASAADQRAPLGGGARSSLAPTVGLVLLSWNRFDLLAACLESVRRSDYRSIRIIVVDNGSTDGSPARLRERFPEVTVIENGRNLGFAAASNIGLRRLLDAGADLLLLLNDDTVISPTMIATLARALASDATIGVVGPTIYYAAEPRTIWFAGGVIDRFGQAGHPRAGEQDQDGDAPPRDVDYISGCALMVRRAALERVGLLDERFFAYYEETELCARVRASGYRIVIVPQAKMWHKVRPGDRPSSPVYLYLMARNRLLYLRCTGASALTILVATLAIVRTAASWALRPRHRAMRRHAGTLLTAVRDFWLGRFGAPPAAVQQRQSCPTTPGGRPTSQPA
jgi:GT2 family glycosyltransferase